MLQHSVWSSIFTIQISNNHLIAILQNASNYLGVSAKEISDAIEMMQSYHHFQKISDEPDSSSKSSFDSTNSSGYNNQLFEAESKHHGGLKMPHSFFTNELQKWNGNR